MPSYSPDNVCDVPISDCSIHALAAHIASRTEICTRLSQIYTAIYPWNESNVSRVTPVMLVVFCSYFWSTSAWCGFSPRRRRWSGRGFGNACAAAVFCGISRICTITFFHGDKMSIVRIPVVILSGILDPIQSFVTPEPDNELPIHADGICWWQHSSPLLRRPTPTPPHSLSPKASMSSTWDYRRGASYSIALVRNWLGSVLSLFHFLGSFARLAWYH